MTTWRSATTAGGTSWFAYQVQLWDVSTLKQAGGAFSPVGQPVMHIAFGQDDRTLNIVDYEKTLAVWDLETRAVLRKFDFSFGRDVASASLERTTFAVSDGNQTVTLGDLNTGQVRGAPLTDHPDHAPVVLLSVDAATLVAESVRYLTIWDVATGRTTGHCTMEGSVLPKDRWAIDIKNDGTAVAVGRGDRDEVTLCVKGSRTE